MRIKEAFFWPLVAATIIELAVLSHTAYRWRISREHIHALAKGAREAVKATHAHCTPAGTGPLGDTMWSIKLVECRQYEVDTLVDVMEELEEVSRW